MAQLSSLCESPADRGARLVEEIRDSEKSQYGKSEVLGLVRSIVGAGDLYNGLRKVENLSRGDVFIAKAVGGKIRPWICLSVKEGCVVAVCMSSGDHAPGMIKSEARYWPQGWIGSTVSMFREADARNFTSLPYNNRDHLRDVERSLASKMGLRT